MKLIMKVKITMTRLGQAKRLRAAGLLTALLALTGCPMTSKNDAGLTILPDGGTPASRSDFLLAAGQCALQNVKSFRDDARLFAADAGAWGQAMTSWQRVEVMQFGPTASSTTPGGQDFRDQIYSWPLVSRCSVDETLTTGGYTGGVSSLLINRRGLAAAEYLLFSNPDEVTCGDVAGWAALAATERAARKRAYASAVANDVRARAEDLVTAWEPFVETLHSAGPGNATYPTVQGALNRVSDAIFYLDTTIKDLKLAPPIGLRGCTTPPCLDAVESTWAHHNTANLRANLVGLRQLLEGCEPNYQGVGFDDLLDAQAAFSLRERLHAALDTAFAALDAIPDADLYDALTAHPAEARAFYDALKAVTDLLKSEFVTVLDVELPMGLEGDND